MAMKPCKECGKEVSTSAALCPNCGKKHPVGGLTRPAKFFLGLMAFLVLAGLAGRCSMDSFSNHTKTPKNVTISKPEKEAISEVEKHYKQMPIGGGWTISSIKADGTKVKVKVLIPQASEIMADSIEKQQTIMTTVCCPGEKEPLWKSIEGYNIEIEAATPKGQVFANVPCPTYTRTVSAHNTESNINTQSLQLPPRKKYNHKYKIITKYIPKSKFDDSGNYTNISIKYIKLKKSLDFQPWYCYDGKSPKIPSEATFSFYFVHDNIEYGSDSELILLADGNRMSFTKPNYSNSFNSGDIIECIHFTIPIKQFIDIQNAKIIEGKLGEVEFRFNKSQIEALKDMASRMQ